MANCGANMQSKRVPFQTFVTINDLPKAVECYDKIGECSRASVQQKVNALREAMELCNTLQVKIHALDPEHCSMKTRNASTPLVLSTVLPRIAELCARHALEPNSGYWRLYIP
jgi:hypothetical protein